jgi:hypothetical protein
MPITECEGCGGEESDDESDTLADDDLDGHANYHKNDGHEFGDEPDENVDFDFWDCEHKWIPPRKRLYEVDVKVDCHSCLNPLEFPVATISSKTQTEDTPMSGYSTEPSWPSNIYGEPAWQCLGGHMICNICPRTSPDGQNGNEEWEFECPCGQRCQNCVDLYEEKNSTVMWECEFCEIIVCGNCKDDDLF